MRWTMAGKAWRWSSRRRAPVVPKHERQTVIAACDRLIHEVLQPKFLPEIVPTEWNYPVGIYGKWHANRFRFIQRFRSDRSDAIASEFDAPSRVLNGWHPGCLMLRITGILANG